MGFLLSTHKNTHEHTQNHVEYKCGITSVTFKKRKVNNMNTATQTQQPVEVEGQRELKIIHSKPQPKKNRQGGYLADWIALLNPTKPTKAQKQQSLDYLHKSGVLAQHRLALEVGAHISPI